MTRVGISAAEVLGEQHEGLARPCRPTHSERAVDREDGQRQEMQDRGGRVQMRDRQADEPIETGASDDQLVGIVGWSKDSWQT